LFSFTSEKKPSGACADDADDDLRNVAADFYADGLDV
jgi:hypothetical protein